jgi:ribosomal protein L28
MLVSVILRSSRLQDLALLLSRLLVRPANGTVKLKVSSAYTLKTIMETPANSLMKKACTKDKPLKKTDVFRSGTIKCVLAAQPQANVRLRSQLPDPALMKVTNNVASTASSSMDPMSVDVIQTPSGPVPTVNVFQ